MRQRKREVCPAPIGHKRGDQHIMY